jgi:hypothetical protein
MFDHLSDRGHILVTHPWCSREEFLKICAQMDIAMQVSFSETFNIVAADSLSQGVPLVASDEIEWSFDVFNAIPTDTKGIVKALKRVYNFPKANILFNQESLKLHVYRNKKVWLKHFK